MTWKVLERPLPINMSAIPNQLYRERLPKSGCCGEKELLKLWAFSLTEYYRVLHLDMDSLILQVRQDTVTLGHHPKIAMHKSSAT